MAKKHPQKPSRLGAAQTQQGVSAILHEAFVSIRQGNYDRAIARLGQALARKPGSAEEGTAHRLRAEAYLRGALTQTNLDQRLRMIETALRDTPGAPRLRFYRGLALWELGRRDETLAEWNAVAADRPDWPGLPFLRALVQVALKRPWQTPNLGPAEAGTLHFLQAVLKGQDAYAAEIATGEMIGDMAAAWQSLAAMLTTNAAPDPTLLIPPPTADRTAVAILNYYRGVAAYRAGATAAADNAWMQASKDGWNSPWLIGNMGARQRQSIIALAEQGKWQEVVAIADKMPSLIGADRILAETVALAHNHLGYAAAQTGAWAKAALHWSKANEHAGTRQLAQNLALASEAQENWTAAAEAWREMVRRRPRKTDHPDYLSDDQVAAIWHHAAICHQRAEDAAEAVTCLKNASKYAGDDIDIRLALARALNDNDQIQAAFNEVERILDRDPDNIEALVLRGHMMEPGWNHEQINVWKRVLNLQPDHVEAKEALAQAYLNYPPARYLYNHEEKIEFFEDALKTLPDHPFLLLPLAHSLRETNQADKAIAAYKRAYLANSNSLEIADIVIHELLHLNAIADVETIITRVRTETQLLLPAFWLDQANQVLECKLGNEWIERFIGEAIALTTQPYVDETPALVLVRACEIFIGREDTVLLTSYLDRLRAQYAQSGAVEYIEARLASAQGDTRAVKRLLATGRRLARLAHENKLLDLMAEDRFAFGGRLPSGLPLPGGLPPLSPELLRILMDAFPDGPPDPDEIDEFLDEILNPRRPRRPPL